MGEHYYNKLHDINNFINFINIVFGNRLANLVWRALN